MKQVNAANDCIRIFEAGISAVNPERIISEKLCLKGDILTVKSGDKIIARDLGKYSSLYVIGAGKASAKMALAVEKILGERITRGLVVVKDGHIEKTKKIKLIEAAHPVPDSRSVAGSDGIIDICSKADENSLILNLLSGGGSALLCKPYQDESLQLTLEDKQETTRQLLACGAEIHEINCIRKHLSGIKGGRLARIMYPADSINLILSDVVGDRLDSIASGLTVPDNSDFARAISILDKYSLSAKLPGRVIQLIKEGAEGNREETPKSLDPAFSRVENVIVGSNYQALKSAKREAELLGYTTSILSSQITGEAREAAKFYFGIGAHICTHTDIAQDSTCIIAGGETTVTIKGKGTGGRNQEMALAFLNELRFRPDVGENLIFLSGATDGNDGPTDAAGGIVYSDTIEKIGTLDIQKYLSDNDSYHCLEKLGALIKTGPTNTNVCDIQIIIVTK